MTYRYGSGSPFKTKWCYTKRELTHPRRELAPARALLSWCHSSSTRVPHNEASTVLCILCTPLIPSRPQALHSTSTPHGTTGSTLQSPNNSTRPTNAGRTFFSPLMPDFTSVVLDRTIVSSLVSLPTVAKQPIDQTFPHRSIPSRLPGTGGAGRGK